MPAVEVAVLTLAVLVPEVLPVTLLEAARIDGEDLRVVLGRGVVVRVGVGELAEVAGEGDLGGVVELLPPEEDDLVAMEGLLDRLDGLGGQRLGEVHAVDVGSDVTGDGADRERAHVTVSFQACLIRLVSHGGVEVRRSHLTGTCEEE